MVVLVLELQITDDVSLIEKWGYRFTKETNALWRKVMDQVISIGIQKARDIQVSIAPG